MDGLENDLKGEIASLVHLYKDLEDVINIDQLHKLYSKSLYEKALEAIKFLNTKPSTPESRISIFNINSMSDMLLFKLEAKDQNNPTPYLTYIQKTMVKIYNPNYGDNRECECGHPYYRHFDSYEDMYPCGCKYCGCWHFKEKLKGNDNDKS